MESQGKRTVLEFLDLVLYLEKPSEVAVSGANSIFGALFQMRGEVGSDNSRRGREVDFRNCEETFSHFSLRVPPYDKNNCLTAPKQQNLTIAWNMLEFVVDLEEGTLWATPEEETIHESLSDTAIQELQ